MKKGPRSHCPISLALEAIGDKWSLLILRDLILRGKQHYHEFRSSGEGIATNILADRLIRLEQQGLISKSDDPDDKRQLRYAPTQKALDLLPAIFEMARWSLKHDPRADLPRASGEIMGSFSRLMADRKRVLKRPPVPRNHRASASRSTSTRRP